MPTTERVLVRNIQGFFKVLYAQITEDNWTKHEEADASYFNLRAEIEAFYDETYKAHENTDAYIRNYEKILLTFKDQHLKGINTILINLYIVQEAVKKDHALNAKLLEATDVYIKNSSNLTKLNTHIKEVIEIYRQSSTNLLNLAEMLREANVPSLMHTLEAIQNTINTQANHHDTLCKSYRSLSWNFGPLLTKIEDSQDLMKSNLATLIADTSNIKEMVIKMFYAFKGPLFSTPSGSAWIPTLTITKANATVGGENLAHIVSDSPFILSLDKSPKRQMVETPSRPKGEQMDTVTEEA
ncbi:hypothetical protein Tco_0869853 [Tanacetum coccineum]